MYVMERVICLYQTISINISCVCSESGENTVLYIYFKTSSNNTPQTAHCAWYGCDHSFKSTFSAAAETGLPRTNLDTRTQ